VTEKEAIVIPFNPHINFWGGSAIGSLIAHKWFADKHGAVLWDLVHAGPHPEVKTAYFYDPEISAVTFKSIVERIERKENMDKNDEKFLPNWRKGDWDEKQEPGHVWLKLRDINPLKREYQLSRFTKISGGKLERVQNFAIVVDPELEVNKEKITVEEMIDDCIYRLAAQKDEKLEEKQIEEILWNLMLEKNLEFVDRQRGTDNRIDIAFRDSKGGFTVVEIKKSTADIATLDQIKRYMRDIMAKESTKQVSGIILCRKADADLQRAVKNEESIIIDEYKFSISFPRIKERI
jgi:hypothetical protein